MIQTYISLTGVSMYLQKKMYKSMYFIHYLESITQAYFGLDSRECKC
jgi:hypothetical protein